ncbi:cytochrome c oxidase subunit II [Aureibacter tunicatorum]|nr:cytochrome c oxidase subunit II [Aureibacter tunicatorum]
MKQLFGYFLIAGGFVFAIVLGVTFYILRKFKVSDHSKQHFDTHESHKVEYLTIGFASVLVVSFLVLAIGAINKIQTPIPEGKEPDIIITGHQWWWEINYPSEGVVAANELHIPIEKRLLVRLESKDVIHDWYVPALGRKMDMIPGQSNYVWMQALEPGHYDGACNEYCGAQHAWMRILVVAHEQNEYEKWLADQKKKASIPQTALQKKGAKIFQDKVCSNCHAIQGTGAVAGIGPDLTHLGSRETLLGGKLRNGPGSLKDWLRDPQKVKPGAHMPDFLFTEEELNALTAYLYNLK